MSSSAVNVGSSSSAPITISGLASGLNTSSIIAALMAVEREPVTHLGNEETKLSAEQSQLQGIQASLQQLSFAAAEFALPSLYESSQTVTSSEPTRVEASVSGGAGIGGYEVEVTKLANSAQRTFTFKSPAKEETLSIDGHEFTVKPGESAKELASSINTNGSATVYAAVLEGETLVLSNRATGSTGGEFIKVTGGALTETGTAKEGQDAEYTVEGVAGTSSSNTVTNAIPGVTLTLAGLTPKGPVTIDVQPPGVAATAVEAQLQSFIKLYNSTVSTIETQLSTKGPTRPRSGAEFAVGTLFGDQELSGLLDQMRQAMYEPVAGLSSEMSSPADIGLSTGAANASGASQSALEGQLTLDPQKLAAAIKTNPSGVQQMLEQWSSKLQGVVNAAAEPGGSLETRANGDGAQVKELSLQINNLNELLAQREKALQATYAKLESVISKNTSQSSWLTQQTEALAKSGG
ncbi:MAG TPA: flagellar filament capping protein FliD [Solirubrobacteraceae bacterium]|jgi:flagellar hook-associated protein 2|nr:flagellar filament capping protein FliD [Solirubrobacteraceae bacterium]